MAASNQNSMFVEINRDGLDRAFHGCENITEIGSYSLDIDRTFENSKKGLRYLVEPPNPGNVRYDLKKGFETRIIKERGEDTNVLQWIMANMDYLAVSQEENKRRNLQTDFVCRREILAKILITPFESQKGWELAVTLYNGTYYIIKIESEERKMQEIQLKDDMKCCGTWKFKQYLTSDCKDGVPNTDVPYNNCEAFYIVVKTQLNDHSLVYSGAVDAIDNEENYTYLKTLKRYQKLTFKWHTIKKMWARNHFIGIKRIVCGFRDEDIVVKRLKYLNTKDLPDMQNTRENPHNSDMCLNFLDQCLSFIKSSINTDDHKIVHIIKWSPPGKDKPHRIECSPSMTNSEYNFLPQWYIDATS